MEPPAESSLEHELAAVLRQLAAAPPPAAVEDDGATRLARARIDAALRVGGTPPTLGRFIVLERLGEGGMGVVYAAFDPELDRRVAIKLLRRDRGDGVARMAREAKAMARLSHPNVASIYEVVTHDDCVFLAMELVRGPTLRAWAHAQRRSMGELLDVYVQAGRGLVAAHAVGLVHRDFKPDNAMVGTDGRVRVLDFGLARHHDVAPTQRDLDAGSTAPEPAITRTDAIVGTPAYMAPEQFLGRVVDARSDQFSFCVALHEALTGERPFAGETTPQLLAEMTRGDRREGPRANEVPRHVRAALVRGLAVDPALRWPTMDQLLAELARDTVRERRRRRALVGVGVLALAAVAGYAVDRARRERACVDEGATITEVWGDETRARVGTAVLASGAGHAADTWQRLEPLVDDYARRWSELRVELCTAEHIAGTRTPTLAERSRECLDEARDVLDAQLALLAAPDPTTLAQALASAHELPTLDACTRDVELLQRPAPAEDPNLRARASELSRRLIRNGALLVTDRLGEGLQHADQLLAEAEQLGAPSLHARALVQVGAFSAELGDHARAHALLEQALGMALRSGFDEVAVRAAILLTRGGGSRLGFERALMWGWLAQGLVDRSLGGNPALHAEIAQELAEVWRWLGSNGERESLLEAALARALQTYGEEHAAFANALFRMGQLRIDQGRSGEAVPLFERAMAIQSRVLGPSNPAVARTATSMAVALIEQARYPEAATTCARAVAILTAAFGPAHHEVGPALNVLANVYAREGDYAASQETRARALAVTEGSRGPKRLLQLGAVLADRGNLAMRSGLFAEAVPDYERALAIREEALGPDDFRVAILVVGLAEARRASGEVERSLPLYERALAIMLPGGDHRGLAKLYHGLGEAYTALGDVRRGLDDHRRAAAMCDRVDCPATQRAVIRFSVARSLAQLSSPRAEIIHELALAGGALASAPDNERREVQAAIDAWRVEQRL